MSYEQFAYTYDRLMEGMPYEDWLRFAREGWSRYGLKPSLLVDLGCGTGSLAIPLALDGLRVIGIDLSEDMLAVAAQKAEEQPTVLGGGSVQWVHQDLREWELPEQADTVISFCDCMNYLLEEEDLIQSFRQVYDGLHSGGLFMFDVHTPFQLESYAEMQPFFLNDDDISYIWTSELDRQRMQIEHALTIFTQAGGKHELFRRIDEVHDQRAYPLEWIEEQLKQTGFTDVQVCADFNWLQVPTATSERAFFSAIKP